jgi:hypothetical protein
MCKGRVDIELAWDDVPELRWVQFIDYMQQNTDLSELELSAFLLASPVHDLFQSTSSAATAAATARTFPSCTRPVDTLEGSQ